MPRTYILIGIAVLMIGGIIMGIYAYTKADTHSFDVAYSTSTPASTHTTASSTHTQTSSVPVPPTKPESTACHADAKVCWDGSTVGRTGPNCEFAACPDPDATEAMLRTSLGQTVTGLHVSITPVEIVSDSRCPIDVTCVWAGTVTVRATLATPVGHGEQTFQLNQKQQFGDFDIALVEVLPAAKSSTSQIPDSSYRFGFTVVKR